MHLKNILPLALASSIAAQQSGGPSLADALGSQNASLSSLNALLATVPQLTKALSQARNITILAPSNQALEKLTNNTEMAAMMATDPGMVAALLSYHVLNGTYFASNFTDHPTFIPTMLVNETYSNVTGGQRVEAVLEDDKVTFFSGLRENSTVDKPNVNFTGGTIHIINSVLVLPVNDSATLVAANLTAAAGAVQKAGAAKELYESRDVTIFAPSNDAFNAIGSLAANITDEALAQIIRYHVIDGRVEYSTMIKNGSVKTLGGQNVTFTVVNGTVFVNSAKVVQADVLVNNGVVHILDNVLNPMNTTATADPSATSNPPAFSGASSGTAGVPYTSGVETPTSTAPVATHTSSTSSGLGVPMKTGAVGAAALFGGAAIFVNL